MCTGNLTFPQAAYRAKITTNVLKKAIAQLRNDPAKIQRVEITHLVSIRQCANGEISIRICGGENGPIAYVIDCETVAK